MTARNSEEENVAGMDEPGGREAPGFDIGWAPVWQGRIDPPIAAAQAFADSMRAKAFEQLAGQVAGSAGFADRLKASISQEIAAPLQSAAATADDLANRIRGSLIQPIADAAQAGRPWGVWPEFEPGAAIPGDVLEARALSAVPGLPITGAPGGGNWILTPEDYSQALLQVQSECLPLRYANPARYTQCLQAIESRFPPGSSWWKRFNGDLLALENANPAPMPSNAIGNPPVAALPAVPGGPATYPGQSAPGQSTGVISSPGALFGFDPSQLDCTYAPDDRPPELKNDPNRPRWGSPGVTFSSSDYAEFFQGWPTRSVGPSGETVWTCPIGTKLAWRPNDARANCLEPGLAACYGPQSPSTIPTLPITPGTPIPTVPEAPPGEPVPCVKICGFEELVEALKKPAEQKPCQKWAAYQDAVNGECYVIPVPQPPRRGDDIKLIESDNCAAIVNAVNQKCGKKDEKKPERPAPAPLGFGLGPTACDWILPPINSEIANWENPFGWLLGLVDQAGNPKEIDTSSIGSVIVSALMRFLGGAAANSTDTVWKVIRGFLSGSPCFQGGFAQIGGQRALINLINAFTGVDLEYARIPLEQQMRFLCPQEMPGAVDAARAYLGNTIDEGTARCWIRAAGMRDELYDRVIRASRSMINANDVVRLARRKAIPEGTLQERLRELGYLDQRDYEELWELGRALPGPADIVRFMTRDVDDAGIVGRFGLDDEFGQKFAGLTAELAEAQGIDPDTMKRYWRAHWGIPGPSQLVEMYHRLRNHPDAQGMRVTLDDVETALKQQDILPYWVPRLLETSFRPLRLVDVRRAFFDGSIGLEEVRRSYTDTGYSDQNADILTRHLEKQKELALRDHSAIRAYAAGEMNSAEVGAALTTEGFDFAQVQTGIGLARERMARNKRKACATGIRKRMMRGEFDSQEVAGRLLDLGLDPDQAQTLAEGWACERASKGREFSAAQLCKMYDRGIIDAPTMVARLERLGYTRDDAVRIFTVCAQDVERARKLEEIKRIRAQDAEREKQARELEKRKKQVEAEARRNATEAGRLNRLNSARNKAVIDAGANWSQRTGTDLSESITIARGVYRAVYDQTAASQDTIIRAVLASGKSKVVNSVQDWLNEAVNLAQVGTFPDPNSPPVEE